ncbi:hypothetical protein Tco_0515361 [Tanacetum coccineum]|uniref:Uncharacterized protein n=1 Tax=Tanacetum coccineum TaxID=301880 RepID=A0ABQ5DSV0_9ASTR
MKKDHGDDTVFGQKREKNEEKKEDHVISKMILGFFGWLVRTKKDVLPHMAGRRHARKGVTNRNGEKLLMSEHKRSRHKVQEKWRGIAVELQE